MSTAQVMAGYARYTTAEEFGAAAGADAPGTTPIISFLSASSAECVAFSTAASAASVGETVGFHC